ncbi:hypothetical protein F5887DRAFT_1079007 [Amanita rubescens]|nr:hypothetical protein F5887DRAFT_1079007 [Amanita rubescens]
MVKATDEPLRTVPVEFQEREAHAERETLVMSSQTDRPTCPELSPSSPLFPYSNPLRHLSPRRSPLGENAAKAFVETDAFLKLRERTFEIGGKRDGRCWDDSS